MKTLKWVIASFCVAGIICAVYILQAQAATKEIKITFGVLLIVICFLSGIYHLNEKTFYMHVAMVHILGVIMGTIWLARLF